MTDQKSDPEAIAAERRGRLLSASAIGLTGGAVAGLGVVFHDGGSWQAGLAVGAGLGAFVFIIMYVPLLRVIAELLSVIK